ncbi:MAG: hypothetical protein LBM02_08980 [Lachnospiraceae bacterium]|jgi:hypothetical protein|nr:hypothetical protein [Lachnospiraceae bacterium]
MLNIICFIFFILSLTFFIIVWQYRKQKLDEIDGFLYVGEKKSFSVNEICLEGGKHVKNEK